MTVRDLQGTFFGAVNVDKATQHDGGTKYTTLYTGMLNNLTDAEHKHVLDSEIICASAITLRSNGLPVLDITI